VMPSILSVSHRQALPLPLLLVTIASASSAGPTSPGDLKKPHNRFDDNLAQQGRAPLPGQVAKLFKPTETQVIRIVLTGGPCAGKSSSLVQLTEAAKRDGFDVYAAPETATLVFNSGVEWPSPEDPRFHDKVLIFQKALFKLQLQLERSMTNMAACTGRPSIIVFDRGLLDGKAYMTSEGWQALLDGVAHEGRDVVLLGSEISEDYILSRYDGVVHLVTAADGAESFYKSGQTHDNLGNYVFRKETPSEAVDLDQRLQSCWASHPCHVVVVNDEGGFGGKLRVATETVLRIARRTHPQTRPKAISPQAEPPVGSAEQSEH